MATKTFDATNVIAQAVEPLRAAAMSRAEAYAYELIAKLAEKLAEHNWDANAYAPYPRSFGMGRKEYAEKKALCSFVRNLTKGTYKHSRSPGSAEPVEMDEARCAKFVETARADASFQYDMFIIKMIAKIGECSAATLTGSHVWGYSFLTVTKAEGNETWKTQQIVNQSKLGTVFNQWPSRKVK